MEKSLFQIPKSVQNLIQMIVEITNPDQVVLFGSRVKSKFREDSDFDLAVKGKRCSESDWTKLLLRIHEEPITLYPIDLVAFEKLDPIYQSEIKHYGRTLYEKSKT